jgi:hypothetical protein
VIVSSNSLSQSPLGTNYITWIAAAQAVIQIPPRCVSANMLPLTPTLQGYPVQFAGILGFTYHVQRAPTTAGPWTTLSAVTAGPIGLAQYEDTSPLEGGGYYRIVYP